MANELVELSRWRERKERCWNWEAHSKKRVEIITLAAKRGREQKTAEQSKERLQIE